MSGKGKRRNVVGLMALLISVSQMDKKVKRVHTSQSGIEHVDGEGKITLSFAAISTIIHTNEPFNPSSSPPKCSKSDLEPVFSERLSVNSKSIIS